MEDRQAGLGSTLLRKTYLCLTEKKVKSQGTVVGDMVKARRGAWKLTRSLEDPARTRFFSAGSLPPREIDDEDEDGERKSSGCGGGGGGGSSSSSSSNSSIGSSGRQQQTKPSTRLVVLQPRTGRTHQLRVAMRSIGAPIIGDDLYGGSSPSDRVYLHAAALSVNLAALGLAGSGEEDTLVVRCKPSTGILWSGAPGRFDGEEEETPREFTDLWNEAISKGLL